MGIALTTFFLSFFSLQKTIAIVKVGWQDALAYRVNLFTFRLGESLLLVATIWLWSLFYQGKTNIRGYTIEEMVSYLAIGGLVSIVTRSVLFYTIAEDVRTGALVNYIVKPFSYFRYSISLALGHKFLNILFLCVLQLVVFYMYKDYLVAPVAFSAALAFALMIVFAMIIEYQIAFLVGIFSFWIIETDGVLYLVRVLQGFLSGANIPLVLLPTVLFVTTSVLPFAYVLYVPMQVYLSKITGKEIVYAFGMQAVWMFILGVLIHFVWRQGLKRFEGVGR